MLSVILGRNNRRKLGVWNSNCIRLRCEWLVINRTQTAFLKNAQWDKKEKIE